MADGPSLLERRFARLAGELTGRDGVSLGSGRRGFGSGTLQINGRIFAMLSGGTLVVGLPAERVAALLANGDGLPFDGGKGPPMREWMSLTETSHEHWLSLAEEARAFVAGAAVIDKLPRG